MNCGGRGGVTGTLRKAVTATTIRLASTVCRTCLHTATPTLPPQLHRERGCALGRPQLPAVPCGGGAERTAGHAGAQTRARGGAGAGRGRGGAAGEVAFCARQYTNDKFRNFITTCYHKMHGSTKTRAVLYLSKQEPGEGQVQGESEEGLQVRWCTAAQLRSRRAVGLGLWPGPSCTLAGAGGGVGRGRGRGGAAGAQSRRHAVGLGLWPGRPVPKQEPGAGRGGGRGGSAGERFTGERLPVIGELLPSTPCRCPPRWTPRPPPPRRPLVVHYPIVSHTPPDLAPLLPLQVSPEVDPEAASAKVAALMDRLRSAAQQQPADGAGPIKHVVFSQFTGG